MLTENVSSDTTIQFHQYSGGLFENVENVLSEIFRPARKFFLSTMGLMKTASNLVLLIMTHNFKVLKPFFSIRTQLQG